MMIIKVDARHGPEAWALLIRHSPGTALRDGIYVVSNEAARALQRARIRFSVIAKYPLRLPTKGRIKGKRI